METIITEEQAKEQLEQIIKKYQKFLGKESKGSKGE